MSTSNLLIRRKDLNENPTTRCAVSLCLDTSGSMNCVEGEAKTTGRTVWIDGKQWNVVSDGTTRLEELTKGVREFYKSISSDEVAEASAEICIVTFDDTARCIEDFANIYRQNQSPVFRTGNNTAMGEGVNLALDLLERRKQEYVSAGVDYYQPWLVLMTDGAPNGDPNELERAITRTAEAVRNRKLTVFPIAVGASADTDTLSRFAPGQRVLKLSGLDFPKFFQWLSASVATVSQTNFEPITLDLSEVGKWDTLDG
ncbi:MAG: VWA domain-containing protein [Clostridia bacterium]|nr:VWA domain-containing protein [Clostridia bacterium]